MLWTIYSPTVAKSSASGMVSVGIFWDNLHKPSLNLLALFHKCVNLVMSFTRCGEGTDSVMLMPLETTTLRINGNRLLEDFAALSQIGATEDGGVSRPALSLEDLEARAWFAERVEESGFMVRDDDVANLSGFWACKSPDARTLILGSHLDTVPNGGRYDGAIGVLAALEVARTLKDARIELPFHLEVMNFTDEEGTWFSLLGSRGVTARLPLGRLADARWQDGAFRAALARAGIDIERISRANRDPASVLGYLEVHIEQGATLDRLGLSIGVVQAIVGRATNLITFLGESGHSGTTDIYRRKDALQGAALFVTRAHMMAHERFDGTIINCGKLEVFPGTFNVIPERATLLVECRHTDQKKLLDVEQKLIELATECAQSFNLNMQHKRMEFMDAACMDATMMAQIQEASGRLGLKTVTLQSYAGHDAQPMSAFTPTGMIFIPSVNGLSHNPNEYSRWEDVLNGANVLLQTVLNIARDYEP